MEGFKASTKTKKIAILAAINLNLHQLHVALGLSNILLPYPHQLLILNIIFRRGKNDKYSIIHFRHPKKLSQILMGKSTHFSMIGEASLEM